MRTTTEMKLVPIDRLVPYINNARTHSPEQINKLRSSLREFGFINPVIIDRDYGVIAGHGRILAAKEEGITEVPCVLADYLTEAQKKAYIIADNRMAMDAGWDEELLRVEIEALQAEAFDVSLTGFDPNEIDDLFKENLKDGLHDDDFDIEAENYAILPNERVGEYIMLGLRLTTGIDTVMFKRIFNLDFEKMFADLLPAYVEAGFMKHEGSVYSLTPKGMFVSNYILSSMLDFDSEAQDSLSSGI